MIKIFPFTEFLLDNEKSDVIFKQKYLKYYSKKIAGLWNYIDNSLVFYYDYNQILDSYRLLRKTILDYDMEKESIIDTEYMFDLRDLDFEQEVFLMPFDSLLKDIKVNEYIRYTSYEIEKYNANLKKIKSDLEKFLREKKTIIICDDDKKIVNKIIEYFDDIYTGDTVLKPHKESYMNACGQYSPSECLMIGDTIDKDVLGPNKYGIDSIYYNPEDKEYDKKKIISIDNFNEIKELY